MKPQDLQSIPKVQAAVEAVVDEAKENGDYPEIFDEANLVETLHKVIQTSGLPVRDSQSQRYAARTAAFHIGLYNR